MKFSLEHILTLIYNHFKRLDRIGIAWYMGILYTFFLLVTTFNYTVLNGAFYKKMAYEQQTKVVVNPVSRGSIYSSEASLRWALAVSTNLWNLSIDPSQTGSHDKLVTFLSDIVFEEFCTYSTTPCLENMSTYLRTDLTIEKNITVTDLKNKIKNYLQTKINSPRDEVLVKGNLDETTIQWIMAWQEPSLYLIANNLWVNPTKIVDRNALWVKISGALGISKEEIDRTLSLRKRAHLDIIKNINVSTRDAILKRLSREAEAIKNKEITIEESILPFIKQEDIDSSENLVRYYPERNIAGQITGFVDHEGKGKYGIEGYFEDMLQTESPTQRVIKDAAWRPIGWYTGKNWLSLKNNVDVTLTIDRNIQKEISIRLTQAIEKFRANKWSVIVMDPKTGAIISMVNYPDFDPNSFTDVYDMEKVNYVQYTNPGFDLFGIPLFVVDTQSGTLFSNIDWQRLKLREASDNEVANFAIPKYKYKNKYGAWVYTNDIITALYEPGSVFKAITVAIGIDSGEISPTDTYYDKWYVELDYGGWQKGKISNLASQCSGRHTYIHALDWSCNVGMIDIIQKVWPSLFNKYIGDFGLGTKSNITLDGEHYAQISPYEKWSRTQFFTMSFGQGINITLLQMAAAYSVLANGGVYMEPYIVESLTYPDGRKIDTIPTPLRRVIKEESSKEITAMLIDSVRNGYAKKWWVAGYTIAGKTGTSQIPMKWWYENRILGQDIGHTVTSYGGYAPANNPKFVLIVSINRPRSGIYSETTSSALFSEIAQYLLEYYKVPKNNGT